MNYRLNSFSLLQVLIRILPGILLVAGAGCTEKPPEQQHTDIDKVLESDLVNPGYHEQPDWFKQSFLDIGEDIHEATASGKRVVLYFYQDGCPYCKKLLEVNFSQRTIVEKTRKYFDVIAINIWGDREVTTLDGQPTTEKLMAESMRVMFTPTLLFLNEEGDDVMRLNGYYPPHQFEAVVDYAGQHKEKTQSFQEFLAINQPAEVSGILHQQDSYLKAPYHFAQRTSDKPLVVMFEQTDCLTCDELHLDILERKESRELLEQYDVAVLDVRSKEALVTPDGKQTTLDKWAESLNLQYTPTMVMFNASGKEVFRTEAYLKAFHNQSALDYVLSGAYLEEPNFQRYIQARAEALEAQGVHVDIMN